MVDNTKNPWEEIVEIQGSDGFPNFKVKYDPNEPVDCRKCGNPIYEGRTYKGKDIPIEYDNGKWICHYPNCEQDRLR